MKLVTQDGHPDACQQSVIAMLAGVELAAVIALVGSARLGVSERNKACEHFGIKLSKWGYLIEGAGRNCIGALRRKHRTLWLTLSDALDPNYGHAILLHEDQLYDPFHGLNPSWPWHRYISRATPVGEELHDLDDEATRLS